MPDKRGPGRQHERFPANPEYTKPKETINVGKEIKELAKSINPSEQMPEANQEKINKMLDKCKSRQCKSQQALLSAGFKPFETGKFTDPESLTPGHIGYLFANNVLSEGRPLEVGHYEDGYAFYHKA